MTAKQLKKVRDKLHLTQGELANLLGFTKNAVSRMEQGSRPIRKVTELAVAHLSCLGKGGKGK